MWQSAAQGGFHSVRDIYDNKGVMLWARNQPVDPELMGRLIQRELREPIELCINADDPVSAVVLGAGAALDDPNLLRHVTVK